MIEALAKTGQSELKLRRQNLPQGPGANFELSSGRRLCGEGKQLSIVLFHTENLYQMTQEA